MEAQQDGDLWKEYMELATIVDERLVAEWTNFVDTILVFISLYSAVLTAFIIETSQDFERDPAAITNDLLVAIYERSFDPSLPRIDTSSLFELDPAQKRTATFLNGLLYMSLALSILVSGLASACKLWVIRYSRVVRGTGSPFQRAMVRQRAYSGLKAWRFRLIVEILPVFCILAVGLFGLFIYESVRENSPALGYFVGAILGLGGTIIIVSSLVGSFIPGSPFQSTASDLVRYFFHFTPERFTFRFGGKRRTAPLRTPLNTVISLATFGISAFCVVEYSPAFVFGMLLSTAGVFSLGHPGEEKDSKPRLFELPQFVLALGVMAVPFVGTASYLPTRREVAIPCFVIGGLFLAIGGCLWDRVSQVIPLTTEAEAVAWMITSSVNEDALSRWYQKAAKIADNSPNLRPFLLKRLLPPLSTRITSSNKDDQSPTLTREPQGSFAHGHHPAKLDDFHRSNPDASGDESGVTRQLVPKAPHHKVQNPRVIEEQPPDKSVSVYIDCLSVLVDFMPSRGSVWRNEMALYHETLPTHLRSKLEELQTAGCPEETQHSPGKCTHGESCPYERIRRGAKGVLDKYPKEMESDAGLDSAHV